VTDNRTLLVQTLLSEHSGNANLALQDLADRYLALSDLAHHYRDKCSYGFIYRSPRRVLPMDPPPPPPLDVADPIREASPNA
jgi:hypothetical protein